MRVAVVGLVAAFVANQSLAYCYDEAGEKYHLDPLLLRAIARTESSERALARNRNTNGSTDIGMMQINTIWLPLLRRYGIGQIDLLDPCQSVHVGAWVLAQNVLRYGMTWRAVGAYNAGSESKRKSYVKRVWANYSALKEGRFK